MFILSSRLLSKTMSPHPKTQSKVAFKIKKRLIVVLKLVIEIRLDA